MRVGVYNMNALILDRAADLIERRKYNEVIQLLKTYETEHSNHGNFNYLLGQAYRFVDVYGEAERYLTKATKLERNITSYWLALGIVQQLMNKFIDSEKSLINALEINPDHIPSYNSLGVTRRKSDNFEGAQKAYEGGLKKLGLSIIYEFENKKSNPIFSFSDLPVSLWTELLMSISLHQMIESDDERYAFLGWPTSETALEEEKNNKNLGLFWIDNHMEDGIMKLFLPNYFNTFISILLNTDHLNHQYANFTGNLGVVLEELGKEEEAIEHFKEAQFFEDYRLKRAGT